MATCELVATVAYDPLYRLSQVYTLLVSFLAIFPLLHLVFRKVPSTTFNSNIKFLYMLYFLELLVSVINSVVVFAHHVVIPFLAASNCDLMVNPAKLIVFQYVGVFGMSSPMLTNIGISIERCLALIFAHCYEHTKLHIGIVIGVIAVVGDLLIVYFLFRDEHFDKPMMSYFMLPDTSGERMNLLCYSLLALNILNLIFNKILKTATRKLGETWRSSLSERFQMEENIVTATFSTYISSVHVFFFMLYLVFTLFIRVIGTHFLTSAAELLAMRGIYVTIPTYNLLVGIMSCVVLSRLQELKVVKVEAEVALPFAGFEGAKNHEQAIMTVWTSQASKF